MEYSLFTGKMSSKDYLKCALFALLEQKNIYKITVKELCSRAVVNRSTFYFHYNSLDAFFQEVMAEVASGLVEAVESETNPQSILESKEIACLRYTKWYFHVHDHADEFRLLLGHNGPNAFRELLLRQGMDWYTQLLSPMMPRFERQIELDILVNYVIHAHFGLLEYYLSQGMRYSPEYMAQQMVNITFVGLCSLFGLQM